MKKYQVQFEVPARSTEEVDEWAKRVWGPCGEICRRIHVEEVLADAYDIEDERI